ncbi:peptidase inhibitor I78 [Caulobacter sp. 17J65-9]|uniref:peptidase inhibitor I78 n=1 Tax=Caulobacter sp. 17J65-9 TaxID=2709382 RepID=UPI0013CD00BA|nr:peptidase inhibitor I78 [Caulobacter sp. 17J65-9]NEX91324.1 peptidase inhibitor I78 [Caulobacter sp. 17J65-9]
MTRATLAALVLALAAASCSPPAKPEPLPAVAPPPHPPTVVSAPRGPDQCGAQALQYLIGKPKTEIPVPVDVDNRRVACTTCPITEEFVPKRLNIFFDQSSGLVTEVRCG